MTLLFVAVLGCAGRTVRVPGPLRAVDGSPPVESPDADSRQARARRDDLGQRLAAAAEYFLEHEPKGFRDDCSGFVEAVADRVGVPLRGSTAALWEAADALGATLLRGGPSPGDLAFFDDTYDRNGNRRVDDPLSHVAVVLDVSAAGAIRMAHAGTSQGRSTLIMDLGRPDLHRDEDGARVNDILRRERRSDPRNTPHLSSECFRGFARFRWEHFSREGGDADPFAGADGRD